LGYNILGNAFFNIGGLIILLKEVFGKENVKHGFDQPGRHFLESGNKRGNPKKCRWIYIRLLEVDFLVLLGPV